MKKKPTHGGARAGAGRKRRIASILAEKIGVSRQFAEQLITQKRPIPSRLKSKTRLILQAIENKANKVA